MLVTRLHNGLQADASRSEEMFATEPRRPIHQGLSGIVAS